MAAKLSYTLREAAQATGLSVRFLCYAIADGRLKSVKVGSRRLIPARDLEAFVLHGEQVSRADASPQSPPRE